MKLLEITGIEKQKPKREISKTNIDLRYMYIVELSRVDILKVDFISSLSKRIRNNTRSY